MPKRIQVGDKIVEFPDGMSDDAISAALGGEEEKPESTLFGKVKAFGRGVKETVVPDDFEAGDLLEGPKQLLTHPMRSLGLVADAAAEGAHEQYQKFRDTEGLESAGHGAAALLPLMGPMAAAAGERLGGDEPARGAGNMVGMLTPFALSKILGKIKGAAAERGFTGTPETTAAAETANSADKLPKPAPEPAATAMVKAAAERQAAPPVDAGRRAFLGKVGGAAVGAATGKAPTTAPAAAPKAAHPLDIAADWYNKFKEREIRTDYVDSIYDPSPGTLAELGKPPAGVRILESLLEGDYGPEGPSPLNLLELLKDTGMSPDRIIDTAVKRLAEASHGYGVDVSTADIANKLVPDMRKFLSGELDGIGLDAKYESAINSAYEAAGAAASDSRTFYEKNVSDGLYDDAMPNVKLPEADPTTGVPGGTGALDPTQEVAAVHRGLKPGADFEGFPEDIAEAKAAAEKAGLKIVKLEETISNSHESGKPMPYETWGVAKDQATLDALQKNYLADTPDLREYGRLRGYSPESTEAFLAKTEAAGGDLSNLTPKVSGKIGPHDHLSPAEMVDAVNGELKPAASFKGFAGDFEAELDAAAAKGLKIHRRVIRADPEFVEYTIAKDPKALNEAIAASQAVEANPTPETHTRLGKAMGYSDADIQAFLAEEQAPVVQPGVEAPKSQVQPQPTPQTTSKPQTTSPSGPPSIEEAYKKVSGEAPPLTPDEIGGMAPPPTPPAPPGPLPEVPLTRAERTGSRPMAMAERAVESSIPGAPIFDKFRRTQQKALIDGLAAEVVKRVSDFDGPPESLGKMAQTQIAEAQSELRAQGSAKYAEIDNLAQGLKVPTASIKAFANEVKAELTAVSGKRGLLPKAEFARTVAILDKIRQAPKAVDFSTMQAFRSNLLAKVRDLGVEIPDRASGIVKKFSKLADESMESAAGPELKGKVRDANAFWRDTTETFNESVIARMAETAPEKLHTMVKGASLEDIRRVEKTVPKETWQGIKAKLLEDVINDAIKGGNSEALPGHGTTPTLRGSSLRNALENRNGFGEARLKAIYSTEELANINKVLELAEKIKPGAAPGTVGTFLNIINASLLAGATTTAGGLVSGRPGVAAAGAATSLTAYTGARVLARIMTRPDGAGYLSRLTNALIKAGVDVNGRIPRNVKDPAVIAYSAQLAGLIGKIRAEAPGLDEEPQQ